MIINDKQLKITLPTVHLIIPYCKIDFYFQTLLSEDNDYECDTAQRPHKHSQWLRTAEKGFHSAEGHSSEPLRARFLGTTSTWNRGIKWFTTLRSLHQHVWHIERISMTTLTFDEGTENSFKSMESTDPSWERRYNAKNLLHGLQILPLKYRSVAKVVWGGETQKHTDLRANLTLFVHHWSAPKGVRVRAAALIPHLSRTPTAESLGDYEVKVNAIFFSLFLYSAFTVCQFPPHSPFNSASSMTHPKWKETNTSVGTYVLFGCYKLLDNILKYVS